MTLLNEKSPPRNNAAGFSVVFLLKPTINWRLTVVVHVCDRLNHNAWLCGVGSVVIRSPAIEFHVHCNDCDRHEQHAHEQHDGVDAHGLLAVITRW